MRHSCSHLYLAVGFLVLAATSPVQSIRADLLTFETTPDGMIPVDDAALADPYAIEGGTVRMFFDVNGNNEYDPLDDRLPVFEQVGNNGVNGFRSTFFNGAFDRVRPGYQSRMGSFFLRHPENFSTVDVGVHAFVVDYDTTNEITELSGEIWDIDSASVAATEQWSIEVLDSAGMVLASQLSPLGMNQNLASSLDSLPWTFQFAGLPTGVDKLRITFTGGKTTGLGFAFNNFSPDVAIPEPVSGVLLATGAIPILLGRRVLRRRVG